MTPLAKNNRENILRFYDAVIDTNGLRRCTYLLEWFNQKTAELAAVPEVVDRSGLSRGDRLPSPRAKQVLALHEFAFPNLPLKRFCDLFGVNYGSARNWRITDDVFPELVRGYASAFQQIFAKEFVRCAASPAEDDFAQAIRMAREAGRYPHEQLSELPRVLHDAIKGRLAEMVRSDDTIENSRRGAQYKILDRLLVAHGEGAGEGLPAFLRSCTLEDLTSFAESVRALESNVDENGRGLLQQLSTQTTAALLFWGVVARELVD